MYDTTWSSLRHHTTPEWLREAKFGIYTHWGIYSVHGRGANTTWYSFGLYQGDENQLKYHKEHFGDLKDFGYTDFIPMFTAEKFDADEWAEVFFDSRRKICRTGSGTP